MKKRILPLLLAVLLVVTFAVSANAAENEYVVKGAQVAADAGKMTFPTDETEHTAICPVCGTSATWLPLTLDILSAGFTAAGANTHYYLTDSVEAAGAKFTMFNGSTYTSCLHLNGKNITNTSGVAIEGAAGKLNIMGTGTVKGGGAADEYSSPATVLMGNKGSVNLYGGTYEQYDSTAATNTVGIGWGGGTVAVYGATINGGTAGRAVYIDGTMGVANAVLDIYGGTIQNGGNSNVYLEKDTTLNMYGGIISGGKASYGGNIYITGGEFNLYDGVVTGGVATTNGGNIYITSAGVMNMSGGTVSGTRDANGNATGGKAAKGGNISIYTNAVLNVTGGTIKDGTATTEGGNICGAPSTANTTNRCYMHLENVTISGGEVTGGPGGNLGLCRTDITIGEGTLISGGTAQGSNGRGGNVRIYIGTIVMTGGKISGGTSSHNDGTDEIWVQGVSSSAPSVMYMLGGVVEGNETRNSSLRVDSYGRLYLGGDAAVVDNNASNAEIYGNGPVYICDGWSGSATIRFSTPGTTGESMSTSKLQVVTLDADRKATVGGSFSGKLKDFTNGAQLIGTGAADGAVTIGAMAVVDAAGNVTVTDDPLTAWATGKYAYIRLYKAFEITDPADGLWIDLNGCTLTLTGSGAINVFDSANDSYKASACGKIINNGTVTVGKDLVAPNGNRYIAVTDGATTMHRISLQLTNVTLRPTAAGLYYKAKFECDETMASKIKRYGVVVSLADMPGADFLTEWDENKYTVAGNKFQCGIEVTSGSVFGIMKTTNSVETNAANGEMKIYANPYICFDMGKDMIVVADNENPGKAAGEQGFNGVAVSLHDALDMLDDSYYKYPAATRNAISNFYLTWQQKGMADWEFENIGEQIEFVDNSDLKFAAGSTNGVCPACKMTVTWTPFSQSEDTTTNIGTAANGAHYYLTEDITYTGSGAGFITSPATKNHTACLHLNGHNLTATAHCAIYTPYANAGMLNVMGNGTVSGNRGSAGVTIYLSSKDAAGRLNLYGGTYVKPESNTAALTTIINGGSIHVYEGAWIRGNGSGFAAYMDAGTNADAAYAFHGGKITGGEMGATDTGAADKHIRSFIIDSNSYVEELNIRDVDVVVNISGAPVIDRLGMDTGSKLTIGDLVQGASISVSTNKVFTHPFDKAEQYLKYFHAWNEPDSISVTDAGELSYDINYEYYMTPYVRDVKAEAIADGKIHYYFMAAKGMIMDPTNTGDMDKWGDSCLVVFPNGETMLIDSGYAIQAPVIIGSLKRMGVTTLDYLVITHPHNDHMGGAFGSTSTFLDEITVEQVYYQDLQYGGSWDGVVASKCDAKGIPYEALWTGDVLTIGEGDTAVTTTMLWPGADADLTIADAANNNSMVFRFDYGEHSSLFTADIYVATETKLREMYTNGELDADLLKVPHHGLQLSSSSLAFLQAVTPKIAVATGSFDINDTIHTRYTNTTSGVGATLLEDRFDGYIHISAGTDGEMETETEK